ncbi:MAG: glycosyltransferase family 9 protein [Desulfovibrio sp.]|jgi:ADP-heptose:LPS heptosyltransferase|nr:glycosyltransferase family 9 protein [Desulfovibrio sp.]
MNILLLNLTRFGDLLQSQAAVHDLVRQGHRVGVSCLNNFTGGAALLSGIAHVAPLPGGDILALLDRDGDSGESEGPPGWAGALAILASWRAELFAAFSPDAVCNLTPSTSARLLARYIAQGRPCSGFFMDGHGFGLNGNAWAAFLQGASLVRGVSPFNIVDIFRKTAAGADLVDSGDGTLLPPAQSVRSAMAARLSGLAPEGCQGFVALQLGASDDKRRWPADYFAQVGTALWHEEGLCPVLLGSKAERHLAERYAQAASGPFCDLCGETSLAELAAALCSSRLLITNDTGTMHLAAGLKTPILALFLATAQPFDTGPYREGSCSVEPDLPCHPCAFGLECPDGHACRRVARPSFIVALARSFLREGRWRTPADDGAARVWLSVRDKYGFIALESLSGHGTSPRAAWLGIQRHYIRQFLDSSGRTDFAPAPCPDCLSLPADMRGGIVLQTQAAAAMAELFIQQGRVLLARPAAPMRDRFLATWGKVRRILSESSCLAALSLLWTQETQAEGRELADVLLAAGAFIRLLQALTAELEGGKCV